MTKYLPPSLLALFAPRPPLEFKPVPKKRRAKKSVLTGLAAYVDQFQEPGVVAACETDEERAAKREAKRAAKVAARKAEMDVEMMGWDPKSRVEGDPYCTLFVARLAYDVTEEELKEEFEIYGDVKRVHLVRDREGKSRGYAFLEYEKESDAKEAYRHADGKRLHGRRVLVDVERGRTVDDWRPRRFGGGLGKTRAEGAHKRSHSSSSASSYSSSSSRYGGRSSSRSSRRDSRSSSRRSSSSRRRSRSRGSSRRGDDRDRRRRRY